MLDECRRRYPNRDNQKLNQKIETHGKRVMSTEPKNRDPIDNKIKEGTNYKDSELGQFRYTRQDHYGIIKLPEYTEAIPIKNIQEPAKIIPILKDNPSQSSGYKRYTSKQRPVYRVIDGIIKKCPPDEEGIGHLSSYNENKKISQKKVTFNTDQSNEVNDFGNYVFTQSDDNGDTKINITPSAIKHNIKIKVEEDYNISSKYPFNSEYSQYGTKLESSSFKRFRNFDTFKDNSYKIIPEQSKTPIKFLNKYEPIRPFKSDEKSDQYKSRTHNLVAFPFYTLKNTDPEILNNRFLSSVEIKNQNERSDYNIYSTKDADESKKVS